MKPSDFNLPWHPDMPLEYRNQIVTGDARELAERIPDESVDLIFTDPVYQNIDDYRWLAEVGARVLKPVGSLLCWQDVKFLPETLSALGTSLMYKRELIWYQSNKRGNDGRILPLFVPCLWYGFSESAPRIAFQDLRRSPFISGDGHRWQKEVGAIAYWLAAFTRLAAIIYDPFTGGGTVPAVCKMLDRNYIAFEIDSTTAENARRRVTETQSPLPMINEMLQTEMII